ncbi:MAG: CvpA family protein [Lachnospiraceae bacterium]|nr:CvpA family protein [Lachnospiraceae bacterium]
MNWLCVVLLAFLALSVANGARKGLVRMVVSLVFMILVMGLSSVLHPYISSYIKENTKMYDTVLDGCSRVINERLRQQQEELTLSVQVEVIDSLPLPAGMKDGLLKGNNAEAWDLFSVDRFSDYLAVYLADLILRAAAFLLSFMAAFIVVKIGQNIAYMLTSLPGISLLNRAAGAAFGLVQACIWIELFFMLVMLVQDTDFGQVLIAAVQENEILNHLYNHNVLWFLLTRLMF